MSEFDRLTEGFEQGDNGGAPEGDEQEEEEQPEPKRPSPYQIEDYLRSYWGDEAYEKSAFAQLARSEAEREKQVRARPKKGK